MILLIKPRKISHDTKKSNISNLWNNMDLVGALTGNNFSTQPSKLSHLDLHSAPISDLSGRSHSFFHSLAVHILVLIKSFQPHVLSFVSCLWQFLDGKGERQERSEMTDAIVPGRYPDANFPLMRSFSGSFRDPLPSRYFRCYALPGHRLHSWAGLFDSPSFLLLVV